MEERKEERNEIRFEVDPDSNADCVGLRLAWTEQIPLEEAKKVWKDAILEHFRQSGRKPVPGAPFITIVMPCGSEISYETFEDIPDEDVPCSCGNPRHWFVRHVLSVKIEQN